MIGPTILLLCVFHFFGKQIGLVLLILSLKLDITFRF